MPGAEGMCAGWEHSFAFEYLWEQTSLLCEWTALMFQGGGCGARQGPRFSLAWRALVRTALSPGPVWVSQPSTGPAWTLEGHREDHFYLLASCGFILWESCSVGVRKKTGKMRTSSRDRYKNQAGCWFTCVLVLHKGDGLAVNCLLLVTGSPRRAPVRLGAVLR